MNFTVSRDPVPLNKVFVNPDETVRGLHGGRHGDERYCFILVGHLLELRINSIIVSATQNWRQHADAAFLAAYRSTTVLLIEALNLR